MNENEKELNEENIIPENSENNQNDNQDNNASEVKFEENDNWQFEAEAPTLENNIAIGDGYEFETVAEEKEPQIIKEKKEKKENIVINKRKLRIVLLSIASAVVAAALLFVGVAFFALPNSSERMNPGNVALTVGDMKVSVGMYNLYYNLVVNNYKSNAGSYIDFTKDFSKQTTVDENGNEITWEEAFKLDTIRQLQYVAAYYEPAIEEGVTLTDEQKKNIESAVDNLKSYASEEGVKLSKYLEENYGEYCGIETIEKFYEQRNICENYYNQMQIKLSLSEDELNQYYEENKDDYITFAYIENQYMLDNTEEINIDEVKKSINGYRDKIKTIKNMKELVPEACSGLIQMAVQQGYFSDEKTAVANLKDSIVVTYTSDTISKNFGDDILKWFKSSDRKDGDTTYYLNEEYGYSCIFLYTSEAKPDATELYSVRHILISPNDDPNTAADASEAEWKAAQKKAEEVLEKYKNGEQTEIAFAKLAEENSADVSTTSAGKQGVYGGEISKVSLGEMVPEFENWATDKSRKYGDVDIVKSDYGYHIMYFIYDGPTYLFNVMSDANNKKTNELITSVEYKEHFAFKKTTVAEPTATDAAD